MMGAPNKLKQKQYSFNHCTWFHLYSIYFLVSWDFYYGRCVVHAKVDRTLWFQIRSTRWRVTSQQCWFIYGLRCLVESKLHLNVLLTRIFERNTELLLSRCIFDCQWNQLFLCHFDYLETYLVDLSSVLYTQKWFQAQSFCKHMLWFQDLIF